MEYRVRSGHYRRRYPSDDDAPRDQGDYGNFAFTLVEGELQIDVHSTISERDLGGGKSERQGILPRLAGLWRNTWVPEVRDVAKYEQRNGTDRGRPLGTALSDVARVLESQELLTLHEGDFFGEMAALGRTPRSATIFASSDSVVMEIRWQGLRDIMKFDADWRDRIYKTYRENALDSYLRNTDFLQGLGSDEIQKVVESALFETYGTFEWHGDFKRKRQAATEVGIATEGDYPDGLLLISAGFARLATGEGHGRRTVGYLSSGDTYGLSELYNAWKNPGATEFRLLHTLTALGYVDVIRIPIDVLERHVFPTMKEPVDPGAVLSTRTAADDHLMEWAVDNRYMNGTKTMVIDLESCVRCDDCVRACAATHGGNPRFRREGDPFGKWMVSNACMHCKDPVCMVGCPTGAIHRDQSTGTVVINDVTCVGCGTCANACPYDNIVMVPIRDSAGTAIVDSGGSGAPIAKATKCDLCAGRPGGPACVQACPTNALQRVDFRDFHAEASG